MPSKHRKKLQGKKDSMQQILQTADSVQRSVTNRMLNQLKKGQGHAMLVTWLAERKKLNAQKLKISQDESYRTKNQTMACINTKHRLVKDKAYAEKNRQQAKINTKRRLMEDKVMQKKQTAGYN